MTLKADICGFFWGWVVMWEVFTRIMKVIAVFYVSISLLWTGSSSQKWLVIKRLLMLGLSGMVKVLLANLQRQMKVVEAL